ncbi:hypothetical protein LQZ19_18975 [Treponema primitia]|uniref:DUF6922 domain-containing protein n=1 Tax=Treponema primitia TaxID=88058 RepID=UPI0039817CB9
MNKKVKPQFSKVLFWDVNSEAIDYDKQIEFVLERVFLKGTEDDERAALEYYGFNKIKKTAMRLTYLDKATLAYLSAVLNVKQRKFKCYKNVQLVNPFGIPY